MPKSEIIYDSKFLPPVSIFSMSNQDASFFDERVNKFCNIIKSPSTPEYPNELNMIIIALNPISLLLDKICETWCGSPR